MVCFVDVNRIVCGMCCVGVLWLIYICVRYDREVDSNFFVFRNKYEF